MLKENVRGVVTIILTLVFGLSLIAVVIFGVDHLIGWVPREDRAAIFGVIVTFIVLDRFRSLGRRLRTLESENESLQRRVRDLERDVLKLDQKDGS